MDKLVKAYLKNGAEKWFLIHIEIQGYEDKDFTKRMFEYFYRIYDKHQKDIVSMSIFTDTNPKYHPDTHKETTKNSYKIFRYARNDRKGSAE